MIIVTGATGTIGKDVVQELRGMGARFRVVARDPEKARELLGDVEIVWGDFADRASLDAAFEGGTKLFLLGPGSPTRDLRDFQGRENRDDRFARHRPRRSPCAGRSRA